VIDWPELPPAVPKPCNDCPWRRNAAPGWLGPLTPEEWLQLAHSDQPIACHQTIQVEDWKDDATRQCKGAAIYRANVFKSPRNPNDAEHTTDPDPVSVFERDAEFVEHHKSHFERYYEKHLLADRERNE
jgi:hypothetical protein